VPAGTAVSAHPGTAASAHPGTAASAQAGTAASAQAGKHAATAGAPGRTTPPGRSGLRRAALPLLVVVMVLGLAASASALGAGQHRFRAIGHLRVSDWWRQHTPAATAPASPTATTTTTTAAPAPPPAAPAPVQPAPTTTAKPSTSKPAPAATAAPPALSAGNGSFGVPAGTALRSSGSMTVDKAGTVLDGVDVRGGITVTAPNVVIRNSRVTGNGSAPWGISTVGGGSFTVEDTTLTGNFTDAALGGDNYTANRVDINHVSNDGGKIGQNVTIANSYVHDFAPEPGAHADGFQIVTDVGNVHITGNRIDVGGGNGSNSALFLCPDLGPEKHGVGPVVVSGNVLGGGGYTLYVVGGNGGAVLDDVTVTNNQFVRDAAFGAVYPDATPITSSGNVFSGSSTAVAIP
jgi:hypothetical protein